MKTQWYLNEDGSLSAAAYEVAFECQRDAKLFKRDNPVFERWLNLLRHVRAARMVC